MSLFNLNLARGARALALGADFVMLGRGFLFGLAALGERGPAHVNDILRQDLKANMGQLGLASLQNVTSAITNIDAASQHV